MATDETAARDPSPRGDDRRDVNPERPSRSWTMLVGAELTFWALVLLIGLAVALVRQWLG